MPTHTTPMIDHVRSSAAPAPAIAIRIPVRLVGIVLFVFIAALLLALASWSVDDPSFSYGTDKSPANWLGFPGAAAADLAFQLLGVGVFAALLPVATWSWSLMRKAIPAHMGLRLVAWIGASALISGMLTFVPTPESWPLPTGLGGLVGQGFSALAALVTGSVPEGLSALLFGGILVAPGLALLWLAFGRAAAPAKPVPKSKAKAAPGAASRRQAAPEPEDDEPEDNPNPVMDVAIGALVHMGYSAKTAFRRARDKAREQRAMEEHSRQGHDTEPMMDQRGRAPVVERSQLDRSAVEPAIEPQMERRAASAPVAPAGRQEPSLTSERRTIHAPSAPMDADFYADLDPEDAPFDEDGDMYAPPPVSSEPRMSRPAPAPVQSHQSAPLTAPRVTAPAARPTQGARQGREAQGSLLLEEEGFELPPLSLLSEPPTGFVNADHNPERLEEMARQLEGVLEDFGVKGDIINVRPGPVVTLFELEPAPGIKSSRVISLADDIARSMSAHSARVAVVQGRNAIGIELPNHNRETVYLREMLGSADFEKMKGKLPICLGKTIGGEPIIVDLARMPHLLIAGTTGSGKSVGINTMILSLLYRMTPAECRMIMIDPKMLELSIYEGIPHLLTPVVTDPSKAVVALKWAVREMEDRYRKMSKIGVRNIDGFNQRVAEAKKKGEVITRTVQTGFDRETGEAIFESEEFDLEPLPFIVIVVDEMADLMMVAGKDIEGAIQRLAQMARAAGIHLITATQRPSVDVITGTIKANFPTRISFMVTSKIDSRTILGEQGAEQLLGNGDMLYMAGGGRIKRLHGPFVADLEVESIVNHLKSQGQPDYLEAITAEDDEDGGGGMTPDDDYSGSGDELYDKAVNVVLQDKKASTSYIQRRLGIGYNKAATLIERMEQEGVISQANHAGKREILVGNNADGY